MVVMAMANPPRGGRGPGGGGLEGTRGASLAVGVGEGVLVDEPKSVVDGDNVGLRLI